MISGILHVLKMDCRCIPGRRNRKRTVRHDKQGYRAHHLVENAFCRLKDVRRVAIRYDKLAANFLSGVALATADASCCASGEHVNT